MTNHTLALRTFSSFLLTGKSLIFSYTLDLKLIVVLPPILLFSRNFIHVTQFLGRRVKKTSKNRVLSI